MPSTTWDRIKEDVNIVFDRDPAARSTIEILLTYPGVHALFFYRIAHWLWRRDVKLVARVLGNVGRFFTGIDIHPGANIGRRLFIDHGMGVVIGETTDIADDVTLYQGVTLGGTSLNKGKRHPTIEDHVVITTGATVLGPVTIGSRSRIGAGSVVIHPVPPDATVVGIPGRVVRRDGLTRAPGLELVDLDHGDLPDPVARAISVLLDHVEKLEHKLDDLAARQGATDDRRAEEDEDLQRVKAFLSEG
ncbi:MAG: serine O-acetyltransferase [Candidatus Binatia bacterium]